MQTGEGAYPNSTGGALNLDATFNCQIGLPLKRSRQPISALGVVKISGLHKSWVSTWALGTSTPVYKAIRIGVPKPSHRILHPCKSRTGLSAIGTAYRHIGHLPRIRNSLRRGPDSTARAVPFQAIDLRARPQSSAHRSHCHEKTSTCFADRQRCLARRVPKSRSPNKLG